MLSVIMLSVIMLSVIMLSVIMQSVVMLNVIMLSVVAPFANHDKQIITRDCIHNSLKFTDLSNMLRCYVRLDWKSLSMTSALMVHLVSYEEKDVL
jgi:hypothetical protein